MTRFCFIIETWINNEWQGPTFYRGPEYIFADSTDAYNFIVEDSEIIVKQVNNFETNDPARVIILNLDTGETVIFQIKKVISFAIQYEKE